MTAYTGAKVFRDAVVKFGGTSFANQCTKAQLTPDTPIQQLRTLVPDGVVTDVDSTIWTLEISGLQDWEAGGLSAYLNANSGLLVSVIIAPKVGSGLSQATVSARILPGLYGGEQGNWLTQDLSLPVQGQPTFGTQA